MRPASAASASARTGATCSGNNDILTLTRPEIITDIHRAYLEAGADIIETNTFNSNSVSQADYGTGGAGARAQLSRRAPGTPRCRRVRASTPASPRFVAGALGPTSRMTSLSPDVNDPGFRSVTFDDLVATYLEAARGAGAGRRRPAADRDHDRHAERQGGDLRGAERCSTRPASTLPLAISGTITDASGRVLSGQTTEAFWNSIRHAQPLFIGLNCALGGQQLRPYVQELAAVADTYVCAYPNAGLPNAFGEYDESAGGDRRDPARVRRVRAGQHRRWLLWHHARAHPPDARGRARAQAAAAPADRGRSAACPGSSRSTSTRTACS